MALDNMSLGEQIYKLRRVSYQEAANLIYEWANTKVINRAHHQFLCEHHFGGKPITDPQIIKYITYHEDNEKPERSASPEDLLIGVIKASGSVPHKNMTTVERAAAKRLLTAGVLRKGQLRGAQKGVAYFMAD